MKHHNLSPEQRKLTIDFIVKHRNMSIRSIIHYLKMEFDIDLDGIDIILLAHC